MNKIEWISIPAPDIERAKEFYSTLFGWKITTYKPGFMVFDCANLHGGLDAKLKPCEQGIGFSITVENIPAKLAEIENAGGKTVHQMIPIGNGLGYFAAFSDPNGNKIELWSKKK